MYHTGCAVCVLDLSGTLIIRVVLGLNALDEAESVPLSVIFGGETNEAWCAKVVGQGRVLLGQDARLTNERRILSIVE